MIYGGMNKLGNDEHMKDIVLSNERGNSQEYVMHGVEFYKALWHMIKRMWKI